MLTVGSQRKQEVVTTPRGNDIVAREAALQAEVDAPVTYVPQTRSLLSWAGDVGNSIREALRRFARPVGACVIGLALVLGSGCATLAVDGPSTVAAAEQRASVDLTQAISILRVRGDEAALDRALRGVKGKSTVKWWVTEGMDHPDQALRILENEVFSDPAKRASFEQLSTLSQVMHFLDMETNAKNHSTPSMAVYFENGEAVRTEKGGKWNTRKNRAYTVKKLGPGGSITFLGGFPVSGHAKDRYPDSVYQEFTDGYTTAPTSDGERMRANAEVYSNNNSQYVYLSDDPGAYSMGTIVLADEKANGRYVTPARVTLTGLEPGKTYLVQWSPYVGRDPNNPTVRPDGFYPGRTFRLIVPADIEIPPS